MLGAAGWLAGSELRTECRLFQFYVWPAIRSRRSYTKTDEKIPNLTPKSKIYFTSRTPEHALALTLSLNLPLNPNQSLSSLTQLFFRVCTESIVLLFRYIYAAQNPVISRTSLLIFNVFMGVFLIGSRQTYKRNRFLH